MVQHLSEKTSSVCASREAKEVDIISRRIVSHQKLCMLATAVSCVEPVLEFIHEVKRAATRDVLLCIQP
jgi:hypothetical protein